MYFVFRNNFIGLKQYEGEGNMPEFHFWGNYPTNLLINYDWPSKNAKLSAEIVQLLSLLFITRVNLLQL